jgi:hypothetical protein
MATIVIPVRDYAIGSHNLGPVALNVGLRRVAITLERSEWTDPASKVDARFELSLDGGTTWSPNPSGERDFPWGPFPVTFSAFGGIILGKDGQPSLLSGFVTDLPQPSNPDRRIRGTVTISGGTVRAPVTIETT